MSIFENYDNISPDYIPDNITPKECPKETVNSKPPRAVFNIKKEFIGYCWYNGEKFDFTVTTDYENDEVQNKTLVLIINNFRGEPILETSAENSNKVTLTVDDEVNELMPSGSYKAVLKCISETTTEFEQLFSIAVL